MKFKLPITVTHRVRRIAWTQYSREAPRGSGYCEDQGEYQILVKEWRFKGIVVWSREIDREDVPSFVSIHHAIFGDSGGWKSKFEEYL